MIVVNGNVDLFIANWFVLWVVELGYIGVLQGLVGSQALARVEHHQVLQQVKCVVARSREQVSQALGFGGGKRLKHGLSQRGVYGFDIFGGGPSCNFHHSVQLVQGRSTWEHRLSQQQLGQNAAKRPHVHSLGVLVGAEEDLRGSVPPGRNVICQKRLGFGVLRIKRSSKTIVGDFYMAL